jgi:hypothetical protein
MRAQAKIEYLGAYADLGKEEAKSEAKPEAKPEAAEAKAGTEPAAAK